MPQSKETEVITKRHVSVHISMGFVVATSIAVAAFVIAAVAAN